MDYRDKSEPLKQRLQNLYKQKNKFATPFILDKFNLGLCSHKGHSLVINRKDGEVTIDTNIEYKQGIFERSLATGKLRPPHFLFKNLVRLCLRQFLRNSRFQDGFWWLEALNRRSREQMIISTLSRDFHQWH